MSANTPTDEPQQGAAESIPQQSRAPQQPDSNVIIKKSVEALPAKLAEVLMDIKMAVEKYPVSDNQAQMADAYSVMQALRTKLMIAVEEEQEFPAQYRRKFFNTFAILALFENELQFLIFLDKKLQEIPQRQGMFNDFKNNAVKYRQELLDELQWIRAKQP